MATPNAETIQGFYEAANRGDLESIRAMLDPEVEWRWPPHGLADRDVFRGPDEFIAGMLQWREAWDEHVLEPQELLERSDEALSIVRYRARGRQSGLELDESVAHVFNFRDGKILQMRMFGNIDKARQRFLREVDKGGADER